MKYHLLFIEVMKFPYFLFYILYFANMTHSSDLQNTLTKKASKLWLTNQTLMLNPKNPYCSICCIDVRRKEKGRQCGIHTMCIYEPKHIGAGCKGLIVMEFSQNEIDVIVDVHNTLRNKIASGMESRGNPGPQPQAANMRIMSWDTELASVASRWATQCLFAYDKCRDLSRFPVGQSVARADYASKSDLESIIDWYELVELISEADIRIHVLDETEEIRHYTQLVWADTFLLGCARVCFQKVANAQVIYRDHFICNYGPSGNIPGQPVYKIGDPCSSCLDGTGCTNPDYPALCGNEIVNETDFRRRKKSRQLESKNLGNYLYYDLINVYITVPFLIMYLYE